MHPYFRGLDSVTGASRTVARIADVLGADTAPSTALVPVSQKPSALETFLRAASVNRPRDVKDSVGTAVGATLGLVAVSEHRVLGAIGGASLGRNLPALLRAADRPAALENMLVTGAAIVGSLLLHRSPIIGFGLGWLSGGAAVYAVNQRRGG